MSNEQTNLVIVESPSKAKTIGKYLGPGYQVKASMGHLRDLPKSKMGIDFDNDFEPHYIPMKGKESVIADLKKAAKESDNIYLATDPDREGEAISWHLKVLLNIPDEKTLRVTFNEITKNVVTKSPGHRLRPGGRPAGPAGAGPDCRLRAEPPAVEEDPPGPLGRAGPVGGHPDGGGPGK